MKSNIVEKLDEHFPDKPEEEIEEYDRGFLELKIDVIPEIITIISERDFDTAKGMFENIIDEILEFDGSNKKRYLEDVFSQLSTCQNRKLLSLIIDYLISTPFDDIVSRDHTVSRYLHNFYENSTDNKERVEFSKRIFDTIITDLYSEYADLLINCICDNVEYDQEGARILYDEIVGYILENFDDYKLYSISESKNLLEAIYNNKLYLEGFMEKIARSPDRKEYLLCELIENAPDRDTFDSLFHLTDLPYFTREIAGEENFTFTDFTDRKNKQLLIVSLFWAFKHNHREFVVSAAKRTLEYDYDGLNSHLRACVENRDSEMLVEVFDIFEKESDSLNDKKFNYLLRTVLITGVWSKNSEVVWCCHNVIKKHIEKLADWQKPTYYAGIFRMNLNLNREKKAKIYYDKIPKALRSMKTNYSYKFREMFKFLINDSYLDIEVFEEILEETFKLEYLLDLEPESSEDKKSITDTVRNLSESELINPFESNYSFNSLVFSIRENISFLDDSKKKERLLCSLISTMEKYNATSYYNTIADDLYKLGRKKDEKKVMGE